MDRVEAVVTKINQTSMKAEVWIDGSFCTEKLNPDDFDVVLRVLEADYRAFNLHQLSVYNWFRTSSLREEFSCDNYAFVQRANDDGTWLVAYWIRQFGFSRADEMKGLLVIETPFLIA